LPHCRKRCDDATRLRVLLGCIRVAFRFQGPKIGKRPFPIDRSLGGTLRQICRSALIDHAAGSYCRGTLRKQPGQTVIGAGDCRDGSATHSWPFIEAGKTGESEKLGLARLRWPTILSPEACYVPAKRFFTLSEVAFQPPNMFRERKYSDRAGRQQSQGIDQGPGSGPMRADIPPHRAECYSRSPVKTSNASKPNSSCGTFHQIVHLLRPSVERTAVRADFKNVPEAERESGRARIL